MGLLADAYSYGDYLKRRVGGLFSDPIGTLEQFAGQMADSRREDDYLRRVAGQQILKAPGETDPVVTALAPTPGPSIGYPSKVSAVTPQQREAAQAALSKKAAQQAFAAATVWHGSPHKFDKFDFSKIGTGEGAQAYGHGGYVAEAPEVATGYQKALSPEGKATDLNTKMKFVDIGGKPLDQFNVDMSQELIDAAKSGGQDFINLAKQKRDRWADLVKDDSYPFKPYAAEKISAYDNLLEAAQKATPEYGGAGYLYKVDLPDEHIAKMLDWDKPLSQQHPDVQKALGGIDLSPTPDVRQIAPKSGAHVIERLKNKLGSSDAASEALRQAGIPGIRYLDGGSRGTGAGTSNFVVFPGNEGLLTILERNGQPLGLLKP